MDNRLLAEKIYIRLKEKGALIGNMSIVLIEQVLDQHLSSTPPVEEKPKCPKCGSELFPTPDWDYCSNQKCDYTT